MISPRPRRDRGRILTDKGLKKLREALNQEFPGGYTLPAISAMTTPGVNPEVNPVSDETISKILNRREGADRTKMESLFTAFGLRLDEDDHTSAADFVGREGAIATPPHQQTETQIIQARINSKLEEQANISQERLFGIDKYIVPLSEYLRDKEGSWFISVAGSGGVGKTSIVDKLVREHTANAGLIDIAWVTAKRTYYRIVERSIEEIGTELNIDAAINDIAEKLQIKLPAARDQHFPYLQNKLRSAPYLIVIDNLETLQDYRDLLTRFNPYSQRDNLRPSKVIFTSRYRIQGLNMEVREVEVTGIDMKPTLDLIRYKGAHIQRICQATDEELLPIYHATNGIPLLILLVYSMIATNDSPLDEIIQSLIKEKNLYTFLYEEALVSISDKALEVLQAMTRFSASIPVSRRQLTQQANLSNDEFQEVVAECTQRSLLTSIARLSGEPHYLIHNLLYEFIRREESSV
jgi:hypothetical protein